MDPITIITLISKALTVAEKGMALFEKSVASEEAHKQDVETLTTLIKGSSNAIIDEVRASAQTVTTKIEQDQLELFAARLNNLKFLLDNGDDVTLRAYMLTARESIDYARNRYREGKLQWLPPFLYGLSVLAATMKCLKLDDSSAMSEVGSLVQEARELALDEAVKALVRSERRIPWRLIQDFWGGKDGAGEKLLDCLPAPAAKPTAIGKRAAIRCASCSRMYAAADKECPYCHGKPACPQCHSHNWYDAVTGYCSQCRARTGTRATEQSS